MERHSEGVCVEDACAEDADRISMTQHDRDLLKSMTPVLQGKRTQCEAARLLGLS